jgi:hypothetical protein
VLEEYVRGRVPKQGDTDIPVLKSRRKDGMTESQEDENREDVKAWIATP